VEPASSEVLQALPQLDADPVLERRTGVGPTAAEVSGISAAACRTPRSKKQKRSVDRTPLRGLPKNAVTRNPMNMSSRSWWWLFMVGSDTPASCEILAW
jgi:hypothetical protein